MQQAFRKRDGATLSFEQKVLGWEESERAQRSPLKFKGEPPRDYVGLTPVQDARALQSKLEEAALSGKFVQAATFWPNGTRRPSHWTQTILEGGLRPGDYVPKAYSNRATR